MKAEIKEYKNIRNNLLSKYPNGLLVDLSKDLNLRKLNFKFHFNFYFYDDALLYYLLRNGNVYEEETTNYLLKNLDSESNFLDVGANIGYYTFLSASIAKEGEIISVEANPELSEHLEENKEINDFSNVKIFNNAAWDRTEVLELNFDEVLLAHGSIINKSFAKKVKVNAIPLDTILSNKRIDLIKMDIEGSEYKAINGLHETIVTSKPKIVVEFNSGYDVKSLVDSIEDFYNYYTIDKNGDVHTTNTDYLLSLKNTHLNVVLIKNS
ncbi:MAG: FkbM family methyltransferase [Nitrososphaerota archaeon]